MILKSVSRTCIFPLGKSAKINLPVLSNVIAPGLGKEKRGPLNNFLELFMNVNAVSNKAIW